MATIPEIEAQGWSLNPARYVGAVADEEDDDDFRLRLADMYEEFATRSAEAEDLGRKVDAAIQAMLRQQTAKGKPIPKPTANTLYFIYIQPGVKVVQGGAASCQAFCGYHNDISGQIFYAAMPYPGCVGCTGWAGTSAGAAASALASHSA